MHKLAIFIDGSYLEKVFENELGGSTIHYEALPGWISGQFGLLEQDIMRTYYYDCYPFRFEEDFIDRNRPTGDHCGECIIQNSTAKHEDKKEFLEKLERIPRFEVRLGRVAFRGWKKWFPVQGECVHGRKNRSPYLRQKGVDLRIAVDLVHFSSTQLIERAVLIAGDEDFIPAVEVVKMHGVRVMLIHGSTESTNLSLACDERIEINNANLSHISIP